MDNPTELLASYQSAVLAKDVDALMQLYDPAVRVFDAFGVWSYEGAAAWRKMVGEWFGSLGTETVKVTFEDVQTVGGAELTVVSAIVTYAGYAATGEALRELHNRITWTLKRQGEGLKIVHEHTSAPIGFTDFKAILQRGKAG